MNRVYLISTGYELLSGATADSNAAFLTTRLTDMGLRIVGKSTVGDERASLERTFALATAVADVIISTGGLGPTFDDLTKIVACEIMGCQLERRLEEEQRLRDYFEARHRPMPEINLRQAMFPAEASVLKNVVGTAPGMYLNKNGKIIILMPGPPREMTRMFTDEVEPRLRLDCGLGDKQLSRRTIKILGLGESQVEERLGDLLKGQDGITAALLAVDGEILVKLSPGAEAGDPNIDDNLEILTGAMLQRLGHSVFGFDDDTLSAKIARLLLEQGSSLAVAESCTGGLLGKMITDLPGSSRYFWGGAISYSNAAKQLYLGVNTDTLALYGAVSPETAREMAEGLRLKSGVDYALAITGIAGPEGGSPEKPVGLVYLALAYEGGCSLRELRLGLVDRELIRIISAKSALDLLRRHIEYNRPATEGVKR
ncbi:MAG: competence/damage-inducible protein A [Syntrophomonadaceae bacterium]